ncbi:hypothetical protein [Aeromonas sp. MdU4]|uniref:hypothetical protein n=1 Tax=Aeromonas sp. MdU4 TaxID=3342819 RepID=UPI0035BABB31
MFETSVRVMMPMINTPELLNLNWFLSLHASSGTSQELINFAILCAQYFLFIIPLILLGHWFLGGKEGHKRALSALVTIVVALLLAFVCATFWFHPRPFMVPLGHT